MKRDLLSSVESYLLSAKAALPVLSEVRGNIIFTLSTSSFYPGRGGIMYATSKFAPWGMLSRLAHEVAPEIRVNGVSSRWHNEHRRPARSHYPRARGASLGDAPGREQDLKSKTPLGLAMGPKDHAGSYVHFASDRARGITGTVVNSDGGIGIRG